MVTEKWHVFPLPFFKESIDIYLGMIITGSFKLELVPMLPEFDPDFFIVLGTFKL